MAKPFVIGPARRSGKNTPGSSAGGSRTISYTPFNKPATITEGLNSLTFSHDPEHARFKHVDQQLGTTLYFNGFGILAEKLTSSPQRM